MNEVILKYRRYDIDWLRIILFALLIWFHYAVFSLEQLFGNNTNMQIFNLPLFFIIGVMHQWRLAALFMISGMGTAFAFRNRTWRTYVKERVIRLGLPLIFGTYILFLGIFTPIYTTKKMFTLFPGSNEMPYGHLWFIYNLLIYSIILTPVFSHIQKNSNGKIINCVSLILNLRSGFGLLFVPALILAINGILFKPWEFGEVGMWWEFPRYLLFFLFGYLMISAKENYFPLLDKIRIPVTIITPILALIWYICNEKSVTPSIMEGGWVQKGYPAFSLETIVATCIQAFHTWFWCLLIFTWASKVLNRPSKWLTYLNEAVYPTYIVHMHLTFLPIAIFGLLGVGYYLGLAVGTILVLLGVMICFEIVRRASCFRIFFGIKGGSQEVKKIFPFNKNHTKSSEIFLSVIFHIITLGMIIGLLLFLITAGIIAEI